MCRVQQVARLAELRLDERNNPAVVYSGSIMLDACVARVHGNIIKCPRVCTAAKMPPQHARESEDNTRFRTASDSRARSRTRVTRALMKHTSVQPPLTINGSEKQLKKTA
jgi:hypothetical protein